MGTVDAYLIALDAATGAQRWKVKVERAEAG
jgi:outer membrane protein assembly factor BamB